MSCCHDGHSNTQQLLLGREPKTIPPGDISVLQSVLRWRNSMSRFKTWTRTTSSPSWVGGGHSLAVFYSVIYMYAAPVFLGPTYCDHHRLVGEATNAPFLTYTYRERESDELDWILLCLTTLSAEKNVFVSNSASFGQSWNIAELVIIHEKI
jgi:hypothetical protein